MPIPPTRSEVQVPLDPGVLDVVISIAADMLSVPPEEIRAGSDIECDLKGDSLDRVELEMAVEDRFKIVFDPDWNFRTIDSLTRKTMEKLAAKAAKSS